MTLGGHRVVRLNRIDSTNAEARRLAEAGERGPVWIVAREQTAGRGRLGRKWVSGPGNLYATLLFTIAQGPAIAQQVGFVAGLAVRDVVTFFRPNALARIKWPNDVLLGPAKVAGILAEIVAESPLILALGIGLNVAHAPGGTPYPTTALGAEIPIEPVFERLAASISKYLSIWNEGRGFASVREKWLAHAAGMGGEVMSEDGRRGLFRGLGSDGALLVEGAFGIEEIRAGDVRFLALEAERAEST